MSILVKIRVNGEQLNFIRKPVITSGDQNVVRCKFTFSDEWNGYTKTATFTKNNEAPIPVPITNDECVIPYTVLSCKCKLYIGVIGEKDGKRITSRLLTYDIPKGAGESSTAGPSTDVLNAAIKCYVDGQNFATKAYVDSKECSCDCADKDYATKAFVEDAVSVGISQLETESEELNIIFCGGDANPETHFDDLENLNYIFNGGDANGN